MMASPARDIEAFSSEGAMLVRHFTDTLSRSSTQSTLEEATIAAQTEDDRIESNAHEARMRRLYEDADRDPFRADFEAADIARAALELTCRKFTDDNKASKLSKIGIHRKTARMAANEVMQQSLARDFDELKHVIHGLESRWRATHGPVYRNFQRMCNSLDGHSKVFSIFPQQNTYTALIAGTLSMFVSAAVNHEAVAETVAKTVADISVKAARCAKLVQVVTTSSMRELLAELYGHVFHFYRDAMEWFLSSKTSKFFGSFNEKLKERFETASRDIQNCMDEMYREGDIAALAMISMVNTTTADMRTEIVRQRQQSYDEDDLVAAGRWMREMLKAVHQHNAIDRLTQVQNAEAVELTQMIEDSQNDEDLTRIDLQKAIPRLEEYIIGTEGHDLFRSGTFWLPDIDTSSRLQNWMSNDQASSTLWISSPTSPGISSAQAAAMTATSTAWQTEVPIISHFCARPRSFEIKQKMSVEEAGLIGLLYSLITQLVQFSIVNDTFTLKQDCLDALDGTTSSWHPALRVFSDLLQATPRLMICVVHGLNDLAWAEGQKWCRAFLRTLFDHQASSSGALRILLTTSGQSRVLPELISIENRSLTQKPARKLTQTKVNPSMMLGQSSTGPSKQ
ncbi:hypothetical protein EJ04DRAFT_546010 [Polyplosphaeria fusca]|uniref:DUF7708 domain-containing protein n=1 Tax=Polyplosphaeria fusca TaxID=682080 RepID=A0A9P4UZA1_9PLEO|nr:hypothetical protein EJ04DRAFT_546010 [Polyplosphaeria fusca]